MQKPTLRVAGSTATNRDILEEAKRKSVYVPRAVLLCEDENKKRRTIELLIKGEDSEELTNNLYECEAEASNTEKSREASKRKARIEEWIAYRKSLNL